MPIKYEETPSNGLPTAPLTEDPPLPAPPLAVPAPEALPQNVADPFETMVLLVERCLGRTHKDTVYRRTLAAWLASRHPDCEEAWWLQQFGLAAR